MGRTSTKICNYVLDLNYVDKEEFETQYKEILENLKFWKYDSTTGQIHSKWVEGHVYSGAGETYGYLEHQSIVELHKLAVISNEIVIMYYESHSAFDSIVSISVNAKRAEITIIETGRGLTNTSIYIACVINGELQNLKQVYPINT